MQVTLSPHAEQLLRQAMARDPDQSADAILDQALARHLEREQPAGLGSPAQNRAELEASLDALAAHSEKIPLLSQAALSRQSLYQDHD